MIAKRAGVIHPVPLTAHHLKEVVEGGLHNDGNVDNDDNHNVDLLHVLLLTDCIVLYR